MNLKKRLTAGNVEIGIASGGGDAARNSVSRPKTVKPRTKPALIRCAGLEQALFGLQILFARKSESPGRLQ